MHKENLWKLSVSLENSYLSILTKCYDDIEVDITQELETKIINMEGKMIKGIGKAITYYLQKKEIPEEIIKKCIGVLSLRPQQMCAYSPETEGTIDVIVAVSKIRKWIFEGLILNKVSENIIEKLIQVHEKYQEIFCNHTKEVTVPSKDIKSICSFYKVVICSGKIESIIDHPNADTLYIEIVDFSYEKRTIVSGLKGKYAKEGLVDQNCLFALNLKPVSFKGTLSFGMILFAKDTEKNTGSPIFTANNGSRLTLKKYPLSLISPLPLTIGDCSKKTLETFFSNISVQKNILMYDGLETEVDGNTVTLTEIHSGTVS